MNQLQAEATRLLTIVETLNGIHGARSGSWSWFHALLTFTTAALAGITAAGVVTDGGDLTTAIAVATAISAAASVAIKPDERREKHKTAADGYGELATDLRVFLGRDLSGASAGGAGADELWDTFNGYGKRLAQIGKQTINVSRALATALEGSATA